METALHFQHLGRLPLNRKISSLTFHNQNARAVGGFRWDMRYIAFRRITTNQFSIPSQFPKFFCIDTTTTSPPKTIMADREKVQSESSTTTVNSAINNNKKETDERARIPPPPEKPLPGDCCGSGCLRCVWDIYYEELDEYDKLCNTIPDSNSKPNKSS